MDVHILLLGGLSVVVAALVQGTLGLGLSLLAAPVVALLDPTLMPGGMLVLGMVMPTMTLAHEWRHVSWNQAGWLTGARVATTPLGVLVLGWLPARAVGRRVTGCSGHRWTAHPSPVAVRRVVDPGARNRLRAGGAVQTRLRGPRVRQAVLTLAALSSIVVIVRAIV